MYWNDPMNLRVLEPLECPHTDIQYISRHPIDLPPTNIQLRHFMPAPRASDPLRPVIKIRTPGPIQLLDTGLAHPMGAAHKVDAKLTTGAE